MSNTQPDKSSHKQTIIILLFVVTIISVSGFFMGLRQTKKNEHPTPWKSGETASQHDHSIKTAPTYTTIPGYEWKPNTHWKNSLENLPHADIKLQESEKLTDKQIAKIINERKQRRAYDGAPPVIPHAISTRDTQSCVACHSKDNTRTIAGKLTPQMSHPMLANCTQCHVPTSPERFFSNKNISKLEVETSFHGLARHGEGSRAFDGAPPVMPHKLSMRQNCMSCHGTGRPHAIKTSHPQRQNCLQCHAQNAAFDNSEVAPPLIQERK